MEYEEDKNMRKHRLFVTAAVLTGLAAELLTGNGAVNAAAASKKSDAKEEYTTIHVGYPLAGKDWQGGLTGIAEYEGFLDEYLNPLGYDAELTGFSGAAPAIHEALISGDLDLVDYAGQAGVTALSNGIDTELLGFTSYLDTWEIAAADGSDITSVEDLKGKKIAYARGTAPHIYLIRALESAGLKTDDVELLNMTTAEGLSALSSGSVDAAVLMIGQETQVADQVALQVIHSAKDSDSSEFALTGVLIGRTEFVKENEDAVTAYLTALFKARTWIEENEDAFYELNAEQTGRDLEVVLAARAADIQAAYPLSFDQTYLDALETEKSVLLDQGLIAKDVDIDNWINDTYLEQAKAAYEDAE